jgi:glycosyltransferase involved in cell wall biosynthesis
MNILHLISSAGFYGAENVVAALARELRQTGHDVHIGVFENAHSAHQDVAAQFEARGASVVRIACRGRVDRAAAKSIRELIARERIEIVHCHGYKADIYGYLAARRLNTLQVSTSHLWTRETQAVRLYEFLDAIVLRRFDAVVAVSQRIGEDLRDAGVPSKRISIIDNGIDLARFASGNAALAREIGKGAKLLIGTAGRLVPQKGLDYFLAAAQPLLKEFPNLLFAIVGDGPDRQALQQRAGQLGIENRVFFTGARVDMADVYASLDIFVLASIDEGMPMVLLEAMASGLPAVATRVGAIPKIIDVGETGLLVPPGDPASLTDALRALILDRALRDRLAAGGKRRICQEFSSQAMAQRYSALYRKLLAQKTAGLHAASMADSEA